ncbi:hypothetical protein [Listeria fleischmannii]|uniref:Uncharacterized protein n=1 Tax=Listeria fleischmannii FSL S10-1203 TaxID=1265822 RepID=W7DQL9_9LIST|nr:hypothetical protein [Listeria fleischmannii]EUJ60350.1 hypothetical protein MCOL2_05063 [Listeria fleischmannii FSL S10-1203]
MSEQDIRYFLLPACIIFILGIAAMNSVASPLLNFFIVTLISCITGVIIGTAYQLVKLVAGNIRTYRAKESPKKKDGYTV